MQDIGMTIITKKPKRLPTVALIITSESSGNVVDASNRKNKEIVIISVNPKFQK